MTDSSSLSPALRLHRLSFLLEKAADQALQREIDLTFSQCMILQSLGNNPDCSQRSVAQCRDLTQAAVSRHVDALEEKKLINREENPVNRREHVLKLTPKGKKQLDKGIEIISAKCDAVFSALSKEEREALTGSIEKLLVSMYGTMKIKDECKEC